MGCKCSKFLLPQDDSVHVALKKEAKMDRQHGESTTQGYVARPAHPLVKSASTRQEEMGEVNKQQ
jgi:hypothetical protein